MSSFFQKHTALFGKLGLSLAVYAVPLLALAVTFTTPVKFKGDLAVGGSISKGAGTFVIDHPLDPKNELLFHSFVESPDAKNLYDGIVTLNAKGEATVQLPPYFEALNKDFRYQFFPLEEAMPNLYIKEQIADNRFTIGGGEPNGRVSWQVTGIRHDPFILKYPIKTEVDKGPDQLVNKGEYLHPDAYEN